MRLKFGAAAACVSAAVVLIAAPAAARPPQGLPADSKAAMPSALRKIDAQILIELERWRRHTSGPKTGVRLDKHHRAWVDIRAEVTPELQRTLRSVGTNIVSTSVEYRSIVGWVPLEHVEQVAALDAVSAINPAPESAIRR